MPKSRWADTEDDAALDAQLKAQKEEKRRKKAEKARLQEQQQSQLQPQPKRPRIQTEAEAEAEANAPVELLQFDGGTFNSSRSVEKFDKLNDIEEGTYGWVSRAKSDTGRIVALKKLKFEPAERGGLPVTGLREIQILKDCSHRNVIELQEVVVGDDTTSPDNSIFLVLDFVEHDLKTLLDTMPQPFLASEIKTLFSQLLAGVSYLHAHYILHRDLKSSNLLLNNRGQLKIADFGMARYVGDPPPKLTQLVVTLWYRAPELLLGAKTYDAAVDMWSVGCIFGELITREPLLQGKNEVDQVTRIFELCGIPDENSWPGFRRLPHARTLKLPKSGSSAIRAKFPSLTTAGAALLHDLLSLNPDGRPTADETLRHEYFKQDPKPKPESMFPTFPSKAGQEKRRKFEPHAPGRGEAAAALGDVDFTGIFQGREGEERGGGFTLRMV